MTETQAWSSPAGRRFCRRLAVVLALGAGFRWGYVFLQRVQDPLWGAPMLDGAIYLDWATRIGWGSWGVEGAFYLAPLYPLFLAGFHALFEWNLTLLYLIQQSLVIAAAGLGALYVRRAGGELAALCAAALLLFHQPWIFFASKPAGESLALFFAFAALACLRPNPRDWSLKGIVGAGLFAGLATLVRPNLLLLPLAWGLWGLVKRRFSRSLLLLLVVAGVLLPIGLRNYAASGHFVPVSSNAGITAYHGNGPGAYGIFTTPAGMSGSPAKQREEATAIARTLSGKVYLDEVQADRWWGRQAISARLDAPSQTFKLMARKLWLSIGSHEIGLDEHPSLDSNSLRATFGTSGGELPWIPFGLLLGLTAAGLTFWKREAWGGAVLGLALLACAATPLLFYMSSRYRLPLAAFLALSAGCGLAAVIGAARERRWGELGPPVLLALAILILSMFSPPAELRRLQMATAYTNAASALQHVERIPAARRFAETAVRINPTSAVAWFNLGRILDLDGEPGEAARCYQEALGLQPGLASASKNLAVLWMRIERWDEAATVSRECLVYNATDPGCHQNRVRALTLKGDRKTAELAFGQAAQMGVQLPPELLDQDLQSGREE